MNLPLNETIYLRFGTHSSTGAATDADSTPTVDVTEDGGTAFTTGVTVANVTTGEYKVTISTSPANGYENGKWYDVLATAVVGGVTSKQRLFGFRAVPAENSTGLPGVDVVSMQDNTVTAAAIAADAIGSSELASTAVTEIQSGLATSSALTTAQTDLTTLTGRLTSARAGYLDNLSAGAVALASALATVATYVDTEVAAIKAKTDQLVFTVANRVDATATLGTDAITAASVSSAAVTKIVAGVVAYSYRSGRTVLGLFRRLGAAIEAANGLKGSTVTYYQPDGATEEFHVTQNTTSGTRTNPVVTNSETP